MSHLLIQVPGFSHGEQLWGSGLHKNIIFYLLIKWRTISFVLFSLLERIGGQFVSTSSTFEIHFCTNIDIKHNIKCLGDHHCGEHIFTSFIPSLKFRWKGGTHVDIVENCRYRLIQISVSRYFGNIEVFHRDPAPSALSISAWELYWQECPLHHGEIK